ncbi:MAG: HlyD family secretion protein, partial [Lysobacterales bacterium]
SDVRVVNYVVQVVPRVPGRVIDVPVEANRPVKKGDVLFRIDPVPYRQDLAALEAKVPELSAKLDSARAYQRELDQQLGSTRAAREAVASRLALAERRERQTGELSRTGAGPEFDHEQARTEAQSLRSELAAATAQVSQVRQKLSARTADGDLSEVAQARAALQQLQAQIVQARWQLDQTTVRAPADGTVINLQLREGSYAANLPLTPVMSFVEREQWVLAMFAQNELGNVEPGNEAEIALRTHPNRIIKCEVDSIVWASGLGQLPISGMVPQTGVQPVPPGRIPVRLRLAGKDKDAVLPMGAQGQGAIYTEHGTLLHMIRKVMIRVSSKLDWLVLKLH